MRYWQVAAGSFGRDYTEYFLKFGMAFVGGETPIANLMQVEVGDVIILKKGMSQIIAIGKIVERKGKFKGRGDKSWLRDFDGWDLEAYCYVDWHVPKTPLQTNGLTRATIQKVKKANLIHEANQILSSSLSIYPHEHEPKETEEIKDDQILEYLISEGLRPASADELTN